MGHDSTEAMRQIAIAEIHRIAALDAVATEAERARLATPEPCCCAALAAAAPPNPAAYTPCPACQAASAEARYQRRCENRAAALRRLNGD